jgi:D-alanine--poly(phosphoribitol) ligase subunit 2
VVQRAAGQVIFKKSTENKTEKRKRSREIDLTRKRKIMDIQKQIVDILAEATGEDFSDNMDQELYESGIMDSMSTVQMLLTLQETFDITVPVSEFNRDDWNTPNKLVEQVKKLQDEE